MKTFLIIVLIAAAVFAFALPLKVFSGRKTQLARGFRAKVSVLVLSAVCLVFCAALACGTTYAWFTGGVTNVSAHSSANFYVTAELDGSPLTAAGSSVVYEVSLSTGSYTLKLTAGGSASTGYAVITLNDKTIYTQQLSADGSASMTLTLTINQAADMTITPCWGMYSGTVYNNGATYVYSA